MRPLFGAKVKDGQIVFNDKDFIAAHLKRLEGKAVFVSVEPMHGRRSLQQNAYYWGVIVKTLANELGYLPDDMHEILKYKFNPKQAFIEGKEMTYGGSTRVLSTLEFRNYNDAIKTWAASELGIYIPDPGEVCYEQN
jgi:hypothetical protein